jgi:hypothetical protein
MASTIKVDTVTTPDGTGNITISRPIVADGTNLTNLPAANLTGTLPAISGANLTGLPAVHRNDIINGGLVVNQENQTAPADDAYTIGDLFLHVGEGTPVMSLETDGPQGTRPWQKMVLDANAQGGLVYFMSNADVQDYIANGKLSFGIQLKTTAATISNARIGILKWTGTADAVTSDVVGTWASDGTNPTLATSWSYENTPANIGLTTSWARHTVEDVTVDSDTKNIAIFVWTDDGTITASDVIGFSEWQCNPGSTVNAFSTPSKDEVMNQVDYYLMRYSLDDNAYQTLAVGHQSTTTNAKLTMHLRREMRNGGTVTSSAAATWTVHSGSVAAAPSSVAAFNALGRYGFNIDMTVSGRTQGWAANLYRTSSSTTFIQMDSRL